MMALIHRVTRRLLAVPFFDFLGFPEMKAQLMQCFSHVIVKSFIDDSVLAGVVIEKDATDGVEISLEKIGSFRFHQ